MVDADPFQLPVFPVEEETLIRVKANGAQPERKFYAVSDFPFIQRLHPQCIQEGILRTPGMGIGYFDPCFARGMTQRALPGGSAFRSDQPDPDRGCVLCRAAHPHQRAVFEKRLCPRKNMILKQPFTVRQGQKNVPVDAAAGIPAGVRGFHVLRADGDQVFSGPDEGRQIKGKGGIPVGMLPQIMAVDPDPGMLVDSLKGHLYKATGVLFRQEERFPIPADPAGQIARAAGVHPVKRMLHRPVMGESHTRPGPVVITHVKRVRGFPQVKPPLQIHISAFPHMFFLLTDRKTGMPAAEPDRHPRKNLRPLPGRENLTSYTPHPAGSGFRS